MNPKTSQDLFNKIRSQFNNIRIGDENGTPTADPEKATFFEFEFKGGQFVLECLFAFLILLLQAFNLF